MIAPHPSKTGVQLKLDGKILAYFGTATDAAEDLYLQVTEPESYISTGYDRVDERDLDWSEFPDFSFPRDLQSWNSCNSDPE